MKTFQLVVIAFIAIVTTHCTKDATEDNVLETIDQRTEAPQEVIDQLTRAGFNTADFPVKADRYTYM